MVIRMSTNQSNRIGNARTRMSLADRVRRVATFVLRIRRASLLALFFHGYGWVLVIDPFSFDGR